MRLISSVNSCSDGTWYSFFLKNRVLFLKAWGGTLICKGTPFFVVKKGYQALCALAYKLNLTPRSAFKANAFNLSEKENMTC